MKGFNGPITGMLAPWNKVKRYISMSKGLNILIIHLEFSCWKVAKSWSYETQFAFNAAFERLGIELCTFVNIPDGLMLQKKSLRNLVSQVVGGRKFDQIWLEAVHSEYDQEFLEYLARLAPVRLAMIGESLTYAEEDYHYVPALRTRYAEVKKRLKYFTHALCVDEEDVRRLKRECGLQAFWWVPGLPEWSIARSISSPSYEQACFSGPVYGKRADLLKHPELTQYMLHLPSLEKSTLFPALFNWIQRLHMALMMASPSLSARYNAKYIYALQNIRVRLFKYWIEGLSRGIAVVQLPHFVKAFPGRVYEGMAAGRPVITMTLKDRPQAMSLFEPGKEILFYQNGPEELIDLIKKLQADKTYARSIAENATRKMRSLHTIELRMQQIARWLDTGDLPNYQ